MVSGEILWKYSPDKDIQIIRLNGHNFRPVNINPQYAGIAVRL